MAQLNHYNTSFSKKTFPITLVCDNVSNAPNIGSLFRTADAFGVEKLILCGPYIPLGRKMTKTSRATEKVVPFEIKEDVTSVITQLKSEGYNIIALEITDNSTALRHADFSESGPIALLIGDENFGISETLLQLADLVIHIDMFGQNSSMNVVQATNIILYEITKQTL
ncbi:TrmH family RNA methyltransferase [Formosa haliotis]|uniref:TrmH family RNA methyltransferase n=1 Tax=Formosa haliotis TaxID=1555194 RepID=UPI000825CB68|nr:TrmH family RNA methyltransferase [Formosa haliotis]